MENLGLEKAGVEYDKDNGIKINPKCQTTNSNIYAVGDCCTKLQFTHMAYKMGEIAVLNSLVFGSRKWTDLLVPRVTYTDPEVAQIGLNTGELEAEGKKFDTYTHLMKDNERAICDGEEKGFTKIFTEKNSGKILGSVIVAGRAGEMLNEITLAMKHKISIGSLGDLIAPYPSYGESIMFAGRQFNQKYSKSKLGFIRKILSMKR